MTSVTAASMPVTAVMVSEAPNVTQARTAWDSHGQHTGMTVTVLGLLTVTVPRHHDGPLTVLSGIRVESVT